MMPGYSPEYVTAIFELYGSYGFKPDEIELIGKGISIISVLAERISGILPNKEGVPDYATIKKSLKENKVEVIELLEKYKQELSSDKYATDKIKDINETIDIMRKIEEIMDKYEGKFCKIEKFINAEPLVDIETYNKAVQKFNASKLCNIN